MAVAKVENNLQINPPASELRLRCPYCCPIASWTLIGDSNPPMSQSGSQRTTDPLNSTSLKWCQDGELSKLDLDRILELLVQSDPVAEALVADFSRGRC